MLLKERITYYGMVTIREDKVWRRFKRKLKFKMKLHAISFFQTSIQGEFL
jgi:hypothetical protein